jgi:hypothetical protein
MGLRRMENIEYCIAAISSTLRLDTGAGKIADLVLIVGMCCLSYLIDNCEPSTFIIY